MNLDLQSTFNPIGVNLPSRIGQGAMTRSLAIKRMDNEIKQVNNARDSKSCDSKSPL